MNTNENHKNGGNASHGGCEHDHAAGLPQKTLIVIAGALTGLGLILKWTGTPELWQMIAFAVATLSGGALVFPAAWKALLKFKLDMNVLMTVAVIGAWIIGEHAEAAAVVFLFALSEWLEGLSAERARNAVRSLMSLTPETALTEIGRWLDGRNPGLGCRGG